METKKCKYSSGQNHNEKRIKLNQTHFELDCIKYTGFFQGFFYEFISLLTWVCQFSNQKRTKKLAS